MRLLLRAVVCSCVALALLAGALLAAPRWAPVLGLGGWDLSALAAWRAEEQRRERELEVEFEETRHRVAARQQVVADLAEGRTTLAEAAACFRRLNEEPGFCVNAFRGAFPGASDEERSLRAVLYWARNALRDHPRRDEILSRLEAECDALLPRTGSGAEAPCEARSGATQAGGTRP